MKNTLDGRSFHIRFEVGAVNTIEIPLSFATAGLVGLGGLAFLIGAVLLLVASWRSAANAGIGLAAAPGRPEV
jgi:hypothetical protein